MFSFARVSAAIGMNVIDYFPQGRRMWFRLHEKGGKHHTVPVHHNAEEFVDAYVEDAGICEQQHGPLFRTVDSRRELTIRRMHRIDVLRMIKRQAPPPAPSRRRIVPAAASSPSPAVHEAEKVGESTVSNRLPAETGNEEVRNLDTVTAFSREPKVDPPSEATVRPTNTGLVCVNC